MTASTAIHVQQRMHAKCRRRSSQSKHKSAFIWKNYRNQTQARTQASSSTTSPKENHQNCQPHDFGGNMCPVLKKKRKNDKNEVVYRTKVNEMSFEIDK